MSNASTLKASRSEELTVIGITVVGGVLIGILGPLVARWTQGISWFPFKRVGQFFIAASQWEVAGPVLLVLGGAAVGLILGLSVNHSTLSMKVTDTEIRLTNQRNTSRWVRGQVGQIILAPASFDATKGTVRGLIDEDLHTFEVDFSVDKVTETLRNHQWPVTITEPDDD